MDPEAEKKKAEEAEKAKAASEAAAAEKAAEEAKKKTGDDAFKDERHKLNKEAEKHRLRAKELEDSFEKFKSTIAEGLGFKKPEQTVEAVQAARAAADAKVRRLMLKSEFVAVGAKDMHDASFAFEALASQFADVKVDVENGIVDRDSLVEKLKEVRKTHAFLFVPVTKPGAAGAGGTPPAATTTPPDGSGQAASGNSYEKWVQLKKGSSAGEAQAFFNANRAAIYANMPKL